MLSIGSRDSSRLVLWFALSGRFLLPPVVPGFFLGLTNLDQVLPGWPAVRAVWGVLRTACPTPALSSIRASKIIFHEGVKIAQLCATMRNAAG
jgi:hypothetical protein